MSYCSVNVTCIAICFFFKQKTAYDMRISDWSSDVCSSDLPDHAHAAAPRRRPRLRSRRAARKLHRRRRRTRDDAGCGQLSGQVVGRTARRTAVPSRETPRDVDRRGAPRSRPRQSRRSEEHTSELQSLMRISYAVFCLKKKNNTKATNRKQHKVDRTEQTATHHNTQHEKTIHNRYERRDNNTNRTIKQHYNRTSRQNTRETIYYENTKSLVQDT